LKQNIEAYPNPFNSNTYVSYSLQKEATVSIKLCNSIGQEISTLLSESQKTIGEHKLFINGEQLNAGIYFCKISIDSESSYTKIVKVN